MEMVIFVGMPACGKSTKYKNNYADTHIRINMDMLRTRNRERQILEACLKAKAKVVIDNTNVTIKERSRYLELASQYKYRTKVVYFDVPVEVCLERNSARKIKVPKVAIYTKRKRMQRPSVSDEGFDELIFEKGIREDMSKFNKKTCVPYEAYFTIGCVRGYKGDKISKEELIESISFFQKEFESRNSYCCGVRVIPSTVVYQGYVEECFDVHVINYPRFPLSSSRIDFFIVACAEYLMEALEQERIAVLLPEKTVMYEKENADESRLHDG